MLTLFQSDRRRYQDPPIPWYERSMSCRQLFAGLAAMSGGFWFVVGAAVYAVWQVLR